jgi:hypothetical protein
MNNRQKNNNAAEKNVLCKLKHRRRYMTYYAKQGKLEEQLNQVRRWYGDAYIGLNSINLNVSPTNVGLSSTKFNSQQLFRVKGCPM